MIIYVQKNVAYISFDFLVSKVTEARVTYEITIYDKYIYIYIYIVIFWYSYIAI